MEKILKKVFLILTIVSIVGCGMNLSKLEKEIQIGIQQMFDKDYKDYEIVVTGVKVIGDKTYKGTVEFLYEGKPYIQPVIIKSTDKEYSYEFKFNPYVIKEEAEKATLKLIEENLLKADKKKFKIEVSEVNLFPNGDNSYDGIAVLTLNDKKYNIKVDVKYSDEGTIMYKIEDKELEKLNSDLAYMEYDDFEEVKHQLVVDPTLDKTINTYIESIANFETKKFKIRVDRLENGAIRYASCSSSSSFANKPDVVLNNGEWIPDGAHGDGYYDFVSGEYTYRVYVYIKGNVEFTLQVLKGEQVILSEDSI
jgi:hypothetical protein